MVVMGRVTAPFGIKGWVKVHPYTQETGSLIDYPVWWVDDRGEWRETRILEAREQGPLVVARFEGCEDRDQALALRGRDVAVPRSALPELADDEYYFDDLVGFAVVNGSGEALGTVERLFDTGANPVMVATGERERLIPFVPAIVLEVDMGTRRIVVDWGLDY